MNEGCLITRYILIQGLIYIPERNMVKVLKVFQERLKFIRYNLNKGMQGLLSLPPDRPCLWHKHYVRFILIHRFLARLGYRFWHVSNCWLRTEYYSESIESNYERIKLCIQNMNQCESMVNLIVSFRVEFYELIWFGMNSICIYAEYLTFYRFIFIDNLSIFLT